MTDVPFIPSQRRALGDAIEASGIPLDEFEIIDVDGDWVGIVDGVTGAFRHKPTGSNFAFEYVPDFTDPAFGRRVRGGYACALKPGPDSPFAVRRQLTWDAELASFKEWLEIIKREVHAWMPGKYQATAPVASVPESSHTQAPPHPEVAVSAAETPIEPVARQQPAKGWSSVEEWLGSEARKRGRFWTVVAVLAGLVLAALALF